MEFLVRIKVTRPVHLDDSAWSSLLESERSQATEYRRQGHISRVWRVPGTSANVGVWEAQDATDLHRLLSNLPLYPHMEVAVECLALHYLEE